MSDELKLRPTPRAVSEKNTTHDLLWAALLTPSASQAARTALLDTASIVSSTGWIPVSSRADAEGCLESTALFLVLAERCVVSNRFILQDAVPNRGSAQLGLVLRPTARSFVQFALAARGFKPLVEPYVSRKNGRCPSELYALVLAALAAVERLITHDPTDVNAALTYPSSDVVLRAEKRVQEALRHSMTYAAPLPATAAHLVFFVDPAAFPDELHRDVPRTLRTAALAPRLFADISGRLWPFELEVAARACEILGLREEAARLRRYLAVSVPQHQPAWLGSESDTPHGPHLLTAAAMTAARHRLKSE